MQSNSIANTLSGIYRLLAIFFALFTLYFAQTLVIPLTIAALLTFLLSPLANFLEKWVGSLASVLLTVLVAFSVIGIAGYVFAKQLVQFSTNFPAYYEIVQAKFEALRNSGEGLVYKIIHAFDNVRVSIFGGSLDADSSSQTSTGEVKLIDITSHLTGFIESTLGSLFNIFSMAGIILLLVVFMLLNRDDLRARIIKLMGQSRISSTTSAMKDASDRVTSYLFRLFVVNAGFGFAVFVGLSFLGIPNAALWGGLSAILRFIPYIGSWIAAIIPIALSLIISDTWVTPVLTLAFLIVLELITAYAIEPLYYRGGTGVSSFALIVAALFWTWLWGPIGLLLSTPLTVCLVVLGQYVTKMNFLRVLLSQEQPLTAAEEAYHRLLLGDSNQAMEVAESYLEKNSLISLHDEVVLPLIAQTEKDFRQDLIDAEKKGEVFQALSEIIEFVGLNLSKEAELPPKPQKKVLCIPTRTLRDELGTQILAQALAFEAFDAEATKQLTLNETFELIGKEDPDFICIVSVAPFVFSHVRLLTARITQRDIRKPIFVCLLNTPELNPATLEKLTGLGIAKVIYTLSQATKTLQEMSWGKS